MNLRLIATVLALFIAIPVVFAQEKPAETKKTKEKKAKRSTKVGNYTDPPQRQDRLVLDFNLDQLQGASDSITVEPYSRGISVSAGLDLPMSNSSHWSFGVGLGITSHNYWMNGTFTNVVDSNDLSFSSITPFAADAGVESSKMSVNYIDAPAEFRWRSNANAKGHSWKIAFGGKVGYRLQVHSKISDAAGKRKTYDYPDVRKWRYGATARVGYGKVGLVGFYSLSDLFENDRGQQVNAWSVGFTIAPF